MYRNDHTDECVRHYNDEADECEHLHGSWSQPQGDYVNQAENELDANTPWCRVQALAWKLQAAAEAEEGAYNR